MRNLDAVNRCTVAIVGAGPVGLVIASFLGMSGVDVLLIEQREELIDYPRAIGIDDESLRTMQAIGLIDNVLPHTTPNHWMRLLTSNGGQLASIEPRATDFGFSRRNAFIQPQVDKVIFDGLSRFPTVNCMFSSRVVSLHQEKEIVELTVTSESSGDKTVRADYVVGCDGGNSFIRRELEVPFEGETAPNKWVVIDVNDDPLGDPNIYLCADSERAYVSGALPHGVRRFEFMVLENETEEQLSQPGYLNKLLAKVVSHPEKLNIIRHRVYTHNARLSAQFQVGRVLLAGDAAHIMPVWQGQGYNSGIRDAANLGWKLALVAKGLAYPELLATYEQERRQHAKAMIDLSVLAGRILAPSHAWMGKLRDVTFYLLRFVPAAKRYILEMRFKPMPRMTGGAIVDTGLQGVGELMIQPHLRGPEGNERLLDDFVGHNFAILAWGTNPLAALSRSNKDFLETLGTRFLRVIPDPQLTLDSRIEGVITLGDSRGLVKSWFDRRKGSIILIRPDRVIAAIAQPQSLNDAISALNKALCWVGDAHCDGAVHGVMETAS